MRKRREEALSKVWCVVPPGDSATHLRSDFCHDPSTFVRTSLPTPVEAKEGSSFHLSLRLAFFPEPTENFFVSEKQSDILFSDSSRTSSGHDELKNYPHEREKCTTNLISALVVWKRGGAKFPPDGGGQEMLFTALGVRGSRDRDK